MTAQAKEKDSSNIDGLYGYIMNLRDCITSTAELIKKQNIKAKQTIFNIGQHFGLTQLTRQKIQQNMDQLGVVPEVEVTSVRVNGIKDKNLKQREKSKGKARVFDEQLKIGDPKKKVKVNVGGTDESFEKGKSK